MPDEFEDEEIDIEEGDDDLELDDGADIDDDLADDAEVVR